MNLIYYKTKTNKIIKTINKIENGAKSIQKTIKSENKEKVNDKA